MTTFPLPIKLQGLHGSPYTRKVVAALRYARIPYRFILGQPGLMAESGHVDTASLPVAKPSLLPTVYGEDEQGNTLAVTDSTPLLQTLDQLGESQRSIYPDNDVLNFVNYLLEDYADEWLTRCMFHYRWSHQADIDKAGTMLPLMVSPSLAPDALDQFKTTFTERQISRLYVVGSNEVTAETIEKSYIRFLTLLDAHLVNHRFLLGDRPSAADFAIFGQLTCLTQQDPTPMALAQQHGPRTMAWAIRCEDLCGYEVEQSDWLAADQLPDTLIALLAEVAKVHQPTMMANAAAYELGEKTFTTTVDGKLWQQPTFAYQVKCLRWINERYMQLNDDHAQLANDVLERANLQAMISEGVG